MLADASFTASEEMLAEKPLAETKKQPVPQNGEICLNHVSFQYEAGVKALDDVSLTIRPGTVTALVGESGAPAVGSPKRNSSSDSLSRPWKKWTNPKNARRMQKNRLKRND